MLGFYNQLTKRNDFIEVEFNKPPYILLSSEGKKLNQYIEAYLKELEIQNQNNNRKYDKEKVVNFIYENKKYEIFRCPINFKFFYGDEIIFKVYNHSQLRTVLNLLNKYYFFYVGGKYIPKLDDILSSCYDIKEIILYPFFSKFFYKFNIEMKPIITNHKVQKELLEPLQLHIEKEEIKKDIKEKNPNILIDDYLIFILNQQRKDFIDKLDDYVLNDNIIEPMKIVGNDGIGKSLTLQFYSSIKLEGYYKLYFNLKLFQKYGFKNYFLLELMRGFLSREEKKINDDMKNYMDCVKNLQKNQDKVNKNIFNALTELISYLNNNGNKYVIILDQFKYECTSEDDFDNFKNSINKEYFRLIICCSLNDGKIKNNMFKEYEEDILCLYDYEEEMIIPEKEVDINEMEIDDKDNNEINESNKINIKNLTIFKNRKDNKIETEKGIENNLKISIEKKEDENLNIFNKNINKVNKDDQSLINNNIKKKIETKLYEPKAIGKLPSDFPEIEDDCDVCPSTPINIYYHNIVDLEEIIKENEPEEIYNFMSNFNYYPKYYTKFDIFRKKQQLIGINDDNKIIENFKKEIINKIAKNIKNYYNKESNSDTDNFNNNIYNYITEFKRKIFKYSDKKINLKELYRFSKKYPMKYIITTSEDELNNISFNVSILNKKFRINYSFPFVEYAINSILDEINDINTKIDIKMLSGSAFGNALELKIRDYLNKLKEKVEIRKVWVLNILSEKLKKDKIKEINNKTLNSSRYIHSEDIVNTKPLKDFNYFYFYPENEDNYLIDSILIKTDNGIDFSIIAFQITKYKDNDDIKSKKKYQDYIIYKIIPKFEKLYKIHISKAYFWFILSNEHEENDTTCVELTNQKIKYSFYSIGKRCFFEERNSKVINSLLYFAKKEALIYSQNSQDYLDNNYINIRPSSILEFEEKLYELSQKEEKVDYEKIRKSFFKKNFGVKLKDYIKNSIIAQIRAINKNNQNFHILFLFSFPFSDFHKYDILNDNLIFLFKYNNKKYIIYNHDYYEIDEKNKRIKYSTQINIGMSEMSHYYYGINCEEKEIEFENMKDLKDSHIIYLYKIYYFED